MNDKHDFLREAAAKEAREIARGDKGLAETLAAGRPAILQPGSPAPVAWLRPPGLMSAISAKDLNIRAELDKFREPFKVVPETAGAPPIAVVIPYEEYRSIYRFLDSLVADLQGKFKQLMHQYVPTERERREGPSS